MCRELQRTIIHLISRRLPHLHLPRLAAGLAALVLVRAICAGLADTIASTHVAKFAGRLRRRRRLVVSSRAGLAGCQE